MYNTEKHLYTAGTDAFTDTDVLICLCLCKNKNNFKKKPHKTRP